MTGNRWLAMLAAAMLLAANLGEVVFFSGHRNGRVEGFDQTDVSMFRAQPLKSKYYNEVWFHEMQFADSGLIVILNFQMHNLGLSSGYFEAAVSVSDAAGNMYWDRSSIEPKEVKIDRDGFGISAGPHRFELRGNQYLVKYRGSTIQADLTYNILTGSFQQGDGKIVFTKSGDFVRYNFPIPWATVSGTVTYNGKTVKLSGQGSMNHDWQVLSPTRFMTDWRAFWFYTPEATVSMIRASSKDLEGKWAQRLMVAEPGKILFSSHDYTFSDLDIKPVPGSKVPCAMRYRVEAVEGDDWLKGEVKVTRIQEKGNILAAYPAIIRKLAELVVSETWSYRFWCEFNFSFHQDGKTRTISGRGTGNYVHSFKGG